MKFLLVFTLFSFCSCETFIYNEKKFQEQDDDYYIEYYTDNSDEYETPDIDTGNPYENCDFESINKNCSLDNECGTCNICVKGKCARGCVEDSDCSLQQEGVKCNKKLNRCLNLVGSDGACSEENCPTGCCYSEPGLTKLICMREPKAQMCGLCSNGEIFIPQTPVCLKVVCSVNSDSCPKWNENLLDPISPEYMCDPEELICTEAPEESVDEDTVDEDVTDLDSEQNDEDSNDVEATDVDNNSQVSDS